MKKLTLYCDIRHECSGYWTKAIDVEKIVELNPTEFYWLKRDTLKDITYTADHEGTENLEIGGISM